MNTNFDQLKQIFLDAVEQHPPDQWDAYLDEACGQDAELRRQAAMLLKAHVEGAGQGQPTSDNAAKTTAFGDVSALPGTVIGQYKLLEQIGEGGFGVVFMAEQTQPIRRKVALKILKPGMDTRQVVARFEAERQALAIMDHPNIAKVLDAGSTPTGRPYFVMELVKGVPITEFCDQNQLTPRQRLELFIAVCQAVQHAHQKGVIHRDLKPSNVLVSVHDTTPVPKVIDFGIAKALGQELTDKTLFTGFAQMVGTPLYMSPEQAGQSLDIDTRSDIYSLGVLLYELLTGTTPFDGERFKKAAYEEIRRIIREEEPPKPSTRLKTSDSMPSVSAQRQTEAAKLTKLMRGELDWIVMKALEKDRNRRYETATSLALDVQRYLHDEPVLACPPSAWYRMRKLARRHKAVLMGLTSAALALVFLSTGLVVHNRRITRERDEKQLALDAAEAERRLAQANLQHSVDAITRMLELTQKHLPKLSLAEDAHREFLQEALALAKRLGDEEDDSPAARRLTAQAYTAVGRIKLETGQRTAAEQDLRRALDLFSRLVEEHPDEAQHRASLAGIHYHLGFCLRSTGRPEEAEPFLVRSVGLFKEVLAAPDSKREQRQMLLAITLHELGYLYWSLDRNPEAEACYGEALTGLCQLEAAFPEEVKDKRRTQAKIHNSLGILFRTSGRLPQAEQAFRQALACSDSEPARSVGHLGIVLGMMGRLEEAERFQREAVRLRELAVNRAPKGTGGRVELALTYRWLALLLASMGKTAEAEQLLHKTIESQEALARDAPEIANLSQSLATTRRYLANLLRDSGRGSQAESAYAAALSVHESEATKAPTDANKLALLALTCMDYGNLLMATGKMRQARALFGKACQAWRQALQLTSAHYTFHDSFARFLVTCPDAEFRDPSRAVESARKAVELTPQIGSCWSTLGIVYHRLGRCPEALSALQKATELRNGGDCTDWFFLAMTHRQLGNRTEARRWYERAAAWMDKHQPHSEGLLRFRAEAAALLGMNHSPKAADDTKPNQQPPR